MLVFQPRGGWKPPSILREVMMMRPSVQMAALLLLLPATSVAQQVVDLDAEPTCDTCRISVALRERLSFVHADVSPYYNPSVAGHLGGVWDVASSPTYPGIIVQFSTSDSSQLLGRSGSGPRELKGMTLLRTAPKGVIAFDGGNSRLVRIHDDGTFGAPVPLPASSVRDFAVVSDSEVLLVGAHRYNGSYYALMKLNLQTGERSYGRRLGEKDIMNPGLGLPVVGLDGRGNATIAYRSGRTIYTVRLSDLKTVWEGVLRQKDLPKQAGSPDVNINRVRPVEQVFGVEYDAAGNLWVFVAEPDKDWRPGGVDGGRSLHRLMDVSLYALDSRSHHVRARKRFDNVVVPGDQGLAFAYLDDIDAVGVFSLRLVPR